MDSIFFDMGVSFVLSAIKAAFKSDEKKAQLRKALMKIKAQIELLYPEDSEEDAPPFIGRPSM